MASDRSNREMDKAVITVITQESPTINPTTDKQRKLTFFGRTKDKDSMAVGTTNVSQI